MSVEEHPQPGTKEVDARDLDFHPAIDMRWEITRNTAETGGGLFEAINVVGAGMTSGPPVHVHPTSDDIFEVIEGELDVCVDGKWTTLRAGDTATAPAGVPHTLRNSTGRPVRLVNAHKPALRFEEFFRDMQSLIERGKIKALPPKDPGSAIYVAMLFAKYPEEIVVRKPPNTVFKALAGLGKALRLKLDA